MCERIGNFNVLSARFVFTLPPFLYLPPADGKQVDGTVHLKCLKISKISRRRISVPIKARALFSVSFPR